MSRAQSTGLLAALRDPQIRRALDAMHADVERAWTVDDPAATAAMSRSALASRFQAILGQPPLSCLTAWPLQLAHDWLQDGAAVLDVALRCGYQTEAAFHRAFKRETGVTPGLVPRPSEATRCNELTQCLAAFVLAVPRQCQPAFEILDSR